MASSRYDLKSISRDDLIGFVLEHVRTLTEEEALAVPENPYITPAVILKMAQVERLAAYYSVRLRMAAPVRAAGARVTLIHHFHEFDVMGLSGLGGIAKSTKLHEIGDLRPVDSQNRR